MELRLPVIDPLDHQKAAAESDAHGGSLRVLWVDDDPAVLRMAEGYLEALSHTGDTAESGEAAIRLLGKGDYDVVITDIGMPGMNGFELAHRVFEITSGATPVLALTGWGQTISQAEQAQCEIHRVLPKPISIRELGKALAEIPDVTPD
jgi:CheY-like chemotaxis protein